jgi:hypothetical protein
LSFSIALNFMRNIAWALGGFCAGGLAPASIT